jgi:large subunit ribosomal protein L1
VSGKEDVTLAKETKIMKKRREMLPDKNSFSIEEAVDAIKKVCAEAPRKFDETVETSYRLGIDARKAEQQLRGTFVLPHGTGRTPRILVFAKGDKAMEATAAGADHVGAEDLAEKIEKQGFLDFDIAIATPDSMRFVGKLGKVLGPRGLMPNPKSGTVTFNLKEAIDEFKKGKVEYRSDKFGIVAVPIGRVSFDADKLVDNFNTLHTTILRARPSAAKGLYVKNVAISPTMGPGLKIEPATLAK